jgi:hypothetical protein
MSSRYSIAMEAREERSKLELLIDLVRSNPAVRSCIQRVYNEIVPTAVQVKESGKELAPDLQRFMGPWLAQFLEHALEMAYMCGFVVFVRKRHEGIEVPVLLPLGSFVWAVEAVTAKTRKRKREIACLYRYAVRPVHPEITPDDIFVFNFVDPTLNGAALPSPMDGLLAVVRIIRNMERRLEAVVEWNASKHIITSERVDMLKDQSIEGMSLLDSFRRYLHTGEHDGINRFYMTRPGAAGPHAKNPTDDRRAQINSTLQGPDTEVYVLPPNTEISELQALDLKTNMLEVQEVLQRQVIQFFQMTSQPDINQKTKKVSSSLGELKMMRHMCRFGSRLLQFSYACVYDVHEKEVEIVLNDPSGINIESADDVKSLHETNTLLPSDRLKLRKRMMQNV